MCELTFDRDEITFYGPARTIRMRGYQLASNAPVVRGVPLNALSVPRDEPRHGTEDGPALLKQVLLDLRSVSLKGLPRVGL